MKKNNFSEKIEGKSEEIEEKGKVERIKDLINVISRAGLTKDQTTNAISDVGSLIIKEKFKREELLELRNWIKEG